MSATKRRLPLRQRRPQTSFQLNPNNWWLHGLRSGLLRVCFVRCMLLGVVKKLNHLPIDWGRILIRQAYRTRYRIWLKQLVLRVLVCHLFVFKEIRFLCLKRQLSELYLSLRHSIVAYLFSNIMVMHPSLIISDYLSLDLSNVMANFNLIRSWYW